MRFYFLYFWVFFFSCSSHLVASDIFSTDDGDSSSNNRRTRRLGERLRDSSQVCSKSQDCMEICDEIYLKARDLNRCYSARENAVKNVADVFDELINPKRIRDLSQIDVRDFRTYLNWGVRSFIDLIDEVDRDEDGDRYNDDWEDLYAYDSKNIQVVLEWMCDDEDVQKAISSQDREMAVINQLIYDWFKSTTSIDEDKDVQDNCSDDQKLTDAQKNDLDDICPDICFSGHKYKWSGRPCECPSS